LELKLENQNQNPYLIGNDKFDVEQIRNYLRIIEETIENLIMVEK
jgi:hypothetical protein